MWQVIIAGLGLGFISSFHCVGMCGPLALALPVQHLSKQKQISAIVLYNSGRILTYTLLGLVFGLAGRHLYIAGWQQWFSIGLGVLLLLLITWYFILKKTWQPRWLQLAYLQVQNIINRFLRSKSVAGYLGLGLANGLLPCGMVYIAIAGALSTTAVDSGMLFMFSYGLGTLPAMLALSLFRMRITIGVRQQMKKLVPVVITCMAVLLILRGMNLGIPFISPVLVSARSETISCH